MFGWMILNNHPPKHLFFYKLKWLIHISRMPKSLLINIILSDRQHGQ